MTTVRILGNNDKPKTLKPIVFKLFINANIYSNSPFGCAEENRPCDYSNIELIALNYCNEMDLMFAYDSDRNHGTLYLGEFNDGVII